MPNLILAFFDSFFWANALSALVLLLYVRKVGFQGNVPVLNGFRLLGWFLLATSVLQFALPHVWAVSLLQGLGVLFCYGLIMGKENDRLGVSLWFWLFGGVALAISVVAWILQWPTVVSVLAPVILMGLWAEFGVRLGSVSPFNMEAASLVVDSRRGLVWSMVSVQITIMLLTPWGGVLHPLIQSVLIPFSGLIHVWTLARWERAADADRKQKQESAEKNLASLFEFMVTIGNAISDKIELDKVLTFVVQSAVKATNADAGAVFLVDEFDDVLKVKAVEGDFPPPYQVPAKVKVRLKDLMNYFVSTPIPLDQTIVGECALSRQSILVRDTRDDARMEQNSHLDQIYISSIMLTPLMQGTKVLGVLAVVSRRADFLFGTAQFHQIQTFGDYTTLTINNLVTYRQLLEKQEMERELGIAAEIQGQLLPRALPKLENMEVAAFSLPAKGVSGDYYDVFKNPRGRLLLAVCDVAGKGIPASLVMVMIRTIIHLVAQRPDVPVNRVMDVVNRGIAGKVSVERFATMALLSLDSATGALEYSNAAHHPLLIYRAAEKTFETLDTDGLPIGLERKTRYELVTTMLHPNDIVVLYTDGIVEAMNEQGQQYTLEAFQQVIQDNCTLPVEGLKLAIMEDLKRFVGKAKQHDDQTLLLAKTGQNRG